ncbi:MAG: FAD-binding oxidoreductase [Anaerolineae bacterium]
MRRWNGWGDDTFTYELPRSALRYLRSVVGPATPPRDAPLESVLEEVAESRLLEHPLICTDPEARLRHARGQSFPDWVALRSGQIGAFPDGVAYPQNTGEVREILAYARERDLQIIPYGGGTSVVGHVNPLSDADPTLTMDLRRMNGLCAFNRTSQLATFGAGVTGPDLEAQLRARGYTLGHFPQSFEYSTLGGWIATRSSGQQSLGYGRIEKLFAGGRLESPEGTLEINGDVPASAAGPDLREVLLGSEGRLGIITEATVRVAHLPEQEEFHALFFPNFQAGYAAVREIMQANIPLSMLRLSTPCETETTLTLAGHEILLGALKKYLTLRGAGSQRCMLILGVTGREGLIESSREEAFQIAGEHGAIQVGQTFGNTWHKNRFRTPYLRNTLWDQGYAVDTLETATSWDKVPALVDAIEEALRLALVHLDEFVHVFTHLSHLYAYGSSIYTQYIFRLADTPEETLHRWERLKQAASEVIIEQGATITHQHGIGLDHKPYLAAEKGDLGMDALRALARTFDPKGIMNSGKLLSVD